MSSGKAETPEFVLYTYFRSSCSARVRIALELKSIPYNSKCINLLQNEQSGSGYEAINPSHLVPSLQVAGSGTILTQSIAILEHLEEKYPDRYSLLPPLSDSTGRAYVRALTGVIACDVQPVTNLRILRRVDVLGGSKEEWARDLIGEGLAAFESLAARRAGRFSYGDSITMADVCLVPAVWGAERFGVDVKRYPTISKVIEEMEELEAVKRAHWRRQEDTPIDLRVE